MNVIDKHPMPLKTWRRLFLILWAAVTLVWIILLFKSLDPFGASRVIYDFKVGPKTWLSGEITSVKSDGIAERAGLRVGDVLPQSNYITYIQDLSPTLSLPPTSHFHKSPLPPLWLLTSTVSTHWFLDKPDIKMFES